MNEQTVAVLFDAVTRLERSIRDRDCPAIVVLDGQPRLAMSDYDYLRDQAASRAFELRVAAKARETGASRWVLAVPQVWLTEPTGVSTRAVSNHPLRPGEEEAITWMSVDAADGADYGCVRYTRRPSGEPVFDEPEIFDIAVTVTEHMPGYTLLQEFFASEEGT